MSDRPNNAPSPRDAFSVIDGIFANQPNIIRPFAVWQPSLITLARCVEAVERLKIDIYNLPEVSLDPPTEPPPPVEEPPIEITPTSEGRSLLPPRKKK